VLQSAIILFRSHKVFDSESVREYPVIISEDVVFFPFTAGILSIKHPKSVEAIQKVLREHPQEPKVVLCAKKNSTSRKKGLKLFSTGTVCRVTKSVFLQHECQVVLEGLERVRIKVTQEDPIITGAIVSLETKKEPEAKIEAIFRVLKEHIEHYLKLNAQEVSLHAFATDEYAHHNIEHAVYKIAGNIPDIQKKQKILESNSLIQRIQVLLDWFSFETAIGQFKDALNIKASQKMRSDYQEYVRRTKEEILKREGGEQEPHHDLEIQITQAKHLTKEAKHQAEEELKKLRLLPPSSPEVSGIRTYIEFLISLPWKHVKPLNQNLTTAQEVLELSHAGMEKINERILEFLAVHRRKNQDQGAVLCLIGPPGVGKTSVAKAIAKALHLDFAAIALGGCGDEAEIRGHRRTYIGSAPGRILKALRGNAAAKQRTGSNAVVLLDEIDKLGSDRRGDPYAALLEVLDPEQNSAFRDHYLEIPYDLSKIIFIATANREQDIPIPLKDRMELIYLSGYTTQEKLKIAEQHLVPHVMEEHRLTADQFEITSEALYQLSTQYTVKEAGVRGLKERISALARKIVLKLERGTLTQEIVGCANLSQYLGTPLYPQRPFHTGEERIGVMTGLAWTEAGGETMRIEAVHVIGKGNTFFTGRLGDTMKESVQVALNCLKENIKLYGLDPQLFTENDLHIHFPENAIPKDGPSAGVGIFLTLLSQFLKKPIPSTVAVTGEITTKGEVLRIGGLKEKLVAAVNHDIRTVILPELNRSDLDNVPDEIKAKLRLIFIEHIDEAVKFVFHPDVFNR
jgi:ATP-dependent Lon protease